MTGRLGACPTCGKRRDDDVERTAPTSQKTCVKCGHIQSHLEWACARCGLRFDLAKTHTYRTQSSNPNQAPIVDVLSRKWETICNDPKDQDQHDKFIELCQASGHIQYAGQCYRLAIETASAENKELWSRYQQRIIQRSLLMLGTPTVRSPGKSKVFGLFMLILGALFILGLAFLYFHWSTSSSVIIQQQL